MSDMSSIIEFSQDIADAKAPAPLPARDYVGEVRSAEVTTSRKGSRMIVAQFFIDPSQYPPDFVEGNPDGTNLSHYVTCDDTPQGRWNMKRFGDSLGAPLGRSIDANALTGLRARITVEHEEYEGVMRAKIGKVTKYQ